MGKFSSDWIDTNYRFENESGYSNIPHYTKKERPIIVCLCGSTRFKDAYAEANKTETLAGKVVLSVGLLGHHEGLDMNGPVKQMLDKLHLFKVELADEVLILNVGGYIGESTRRELEYAEKLGKTIGYLEAV